MNKVTTRQIFETLEEYLLGIGVTIEDFYSINIWNSNRSSSVMAQGRLSNVNIGLDENGNLSIPNTKKENYTSDRAIFCNSVLVIEINDYHTIEIKIVLERDIKD